tara:strand:- start:389 stop:1672 length:1284 start_codon:yes stop_codon:yes gene_type:complete
MSTINTNGINTNYPVPGENNSSEGFRTNFTSISNNLDTAGEEITELQQKSVLKTALSGIPLSNDMGNTLISNAAVRSFRATTYNLGNALAGTVLVDTSLGDVQMGTVTGNVTFQFAGWAPTNTESKIKLRLNIANTTAHVTFPSEASLSTNLLENNNGSSPLIIETAPYGASLLEYELITVDCGNSILIEPMNRPWQSTQVVTRNTVTPTGYQGDKNGDVCVAPSIPHVTVTETVAADDTLLTLSTSGFYENMPIMFTGTLIGGVVAGTTYYVKTIVTDTSFKISATRSGADFALSDATGSMQGEPVQYVYFATGTYNSNVTSILSVTASDATTDQLTVPTLAGNTTPLINSPIVFTGGNISVSGLDVNSPYYIKSVPSATAITLSQSRTNGVADEVVDLTTATFSGVTADVYVGDNIWKRVQLDSF